MLQQDGQHLRLERLNRDSKVNEVSHEAKLAAKIWITHDRRDIHLEIGIYGQHLFIDIDDSLGLACLRLVLHPDE